MESERKVRVCIVGMGFGASFIPVHLHHPDVVHVGICEKDKGKLELHGDRYQIKRRHVNLREAIHSGEYDAFHILSGIPDHAEQCVEILKAGLHCACTVPMATSLEDIKAIIRAQRESGKNYMMMETAVYTRQFLQVRELVQSGKLGRIQFLRGAHYQDMENWPSYWMGLPPMWYATHAVSPLLALTDSRAVAVHCFGSGKMRPELVSRYQNPYPIETAIFQLSKPGLAAEVTRTLFHTAAGYKESFDIYGEEQSFQWPQIENEPEVLFTRRAPSKEYRGCAVTTNHFVSPDRQDLLPASIARFTVKGKYDDMNPQKAFVTGGGHHGSHPHLVHEFIRSIVENRKPWIDEIRAADWTAAGICAHDSAMNSGARVEIPDFAGFAGQLVKGEKL